MLTISIREFQLHAGDYLDKLPLVLTRYNIPVARVEPVTVGEVSKVGQKILEKNLGTSADIAKEYDLPDLIPDKDPDTKEVIMCEAPHMKCKEWAVKWVYFEDPDHIERKLNLCQKHYQEAKALGVEIFEEENL